MASMQQIIIVGYLGRDPETRYHQSGTPSTTFSVAVTETWKDRNEQKQERTEWFYCEAWGKTAEVAGEFLQKGSQVQIIGTMRTDEWEDNNTGEKKRMTKLRIRDLLFLNNIKERSGGGGGGYGGQRSNGGQGSYGGQQQQSGGGNKQDDFDDDIPF